MTIALETLPHFGARRLRVIHQNEAAECGLACVAMILAFHGRHIDMRSLRAEAGVSLKGCTFRDLLTLANDHGLTCRPVRAELEGLRHLQTPAILHWDMNHFVVLERATRRWIEIVDPAVGRRRLSLAEASRHVTGVAMECRPSPSFVEQNTVRRLRWRDIVRGVAGLKRQLLIILTFALVSGFIGLAAPQYVQYAIDHAVLNRDAGGLFMVAIGFALLFLFGTGVSLLQSFSLLHLTTSLLFHFRQNLFRHLLFLPTAYFESRSVGDIISRMDSYEDIQETLTVDTITGLIQGLFGVIVAALLFLYSWKIFVAILAYLATAAVINLVFFPSQRRRSMEAVVAEAGADSKTIETVRGNHSIKALGIEQRAHESWVSSQADAVNAELAASRLGIWQEGANDILQIANQIAIPAFALYLVIEGELTIGMFYAVNAYKSQLSDTVDTLIAVAFKFALNVIHLERLGDVALEPTEQPLAHFDQPSTAAGRCAPIEAVERIELIDGSFRYAANDPWIFTGLDFRIEKGEQVSLIGASGSGKTTLLKVLCSLLRPSDGVLHVNGGALQPQLLSSYRRRLGLVMQNDTLFAGSIAYNVARCDGDIDIERVMLVCEIADVHDEIMDMPMQYQTLIGDMGSALSTGQQQRVMLARALYDDPDFLFLDEGTAHIDPDSERLILERLTQRRIGIVFSVHDRAALDVSDRVYSLENGELRLLPK